MHTIKLLLTYYLNISVQAANLSDCRIEFETFFRPNWNALMGNRYSITVPFCEFRPVLMNIDLSAFVQEVKLILLVD